MGASVLDPCCSGGLVKWKRWRTVAGTVDAVQKMIEKVGVVIAWLVGLYIVGAFLGAMMGFGDWFPKLFTAAGGLTTLGIYFREALLGRR
jgi:hypothetical protein